MKKNISKQNDSIQNLILKKNSKKSWHSLDHKRSSQNVLVLAKKPQRFAWFCVSKLILKINLFKIGKYNSHLYRKDSIWTPANKKDVAFLLVLYGKVDLFDELSMMSSVKFLNNTFSGSKTFFMIHSKKFYNPIHQKTWGKLKL